MFTGLQTWIATHRDREEGQALVEYALILALISVIAIGALQTIGGGVLTNLNAVGAAL